MAVSYNLARTIGLSLLVFVIVILGLFFILITGQITNQIHKNLELRITQVERLEKIKDLFDKVRKDYTDYMTGRISDFQIVITSVNQLVREGESFKETVHQEDKEIVDALIRNAKQLKMAVAYYAYEAKEDPTGASAKESVVALKEAEILLHISILNLRKKIKTRQELFDKAMLDETKNGQRAALIAIWGSIIMGFTIASFMGRALSKPIRQLVDGTQRLARGDLTYRVKVQSKDEIGLLANAFNAMMDSLHSTTVSRDSLMESEWRNRAIVNSSLDAVVMMDHEGKVIEWNPNAESIFGWTRDEIMNLKMSKLIIPERYRNRHEEGLKRFLKTGEGPILNKRVELEALNREGKEFSIELSITSIPSGKTHIFCAYINDITDRRKAAKDLNDMQCALDEHSLVSITDKAGVIAYANDKFCETSKYTRDDLIGNDHRIISSGHHPKEFIRSLWRTILDGKIWKGEMRNKAKDGTIFWIKSSIIPFLNEDGKPEQFIAISTDITASKSSAQRIKKANDELAQKIVEVERLNKSMTGRELRIIEVKEEVNKLSEELGRAAPYKLS